MEPLLSAHGIVASIKRNDVCESLSRKLKKCLTLDLMGLYFLLWLHAVQLYYHVFAKEYLTSFSGFLISHFPDHRARHKIDIHLCMGSYWIYLTQSGLQKQVKIIFQLAVPCHQECTICWPDWRQDSIPLAMFIFHEVEPRWESVSSCHGCSVLSQVARLSEWKQMQCAWPGGALRRAPRLPGGMHLVFLLGQV